MLESGSARYIFPLDVDHAHLAIPSDLWNATYRQLTLGQLLPRVLREPTLVALYHTAEHLSGMNATKSSASQISDWKAQRNVLGFFDGEPIRILTPHPDGSGHERIENYQMVITVFFCCTLAWRDSPFSVRKGARLRHLFRRRLTESGSTRQ